MFGSSKSWGLNSTHLHGTHVPVQEPSTASKADMCGAAAHVCFGPKADIRKPYGVSLPCYGAKETRPCVNRKEVAMTDFESIVTSIDSLRALYAQPIDALPRNRLTMSTRLGAHLLPPRHFW